MSLLEKSESAERAYYSLLSVFADLFAAEGNSGGDETARSLRDAMSKRLEPAGDTVEEHPALTKLLQESEDVVVRMVAAARPLIVWRHSGYDDGRIDPKIGLSMQTAYLIGPDAPIRVPGIKAGLFFQAPAVAYTRRSHAAEETFVILAGGAEWQRGDEPRRWLGAGVHVHHPSYVPHASHTFAKPLLCAWRWTGDIGLGSYRLEGWKAQ